MTICTSGTIHYTEGGGLELSTPPLKQCMNSIIFLSPNSSAISRPSLKKKLSPTYRQIPEYVRPRPYDHVRYIWFFVFYPCKFLNSNCMSLGKLFWRTKKGERWVESLKHLKLPYSPYPPYWPYELIPLKPSTPSYMKKCIDYRVRCVHLISWTSYLFQTCCVIYSIFNKPKDSWN